MNPFDMLIIVVLAFSVIRGIFRGLVKELSSIVGVMAGFYAAYSYYPSIAGLLAHWMSGSAYVNIIGFLILFCLVFFTVSVIGVVIKYLLNIAFMGWVDRLCGAGFGLIKGMLIAAVLFILFTAFLPKGAAFVKDSILAPHVAVLAEKMAKVVSNDMKRQFNSKIRELQRSWSHVR